MHTCGKCRELVGQPLVIAGRHSGLNSYYERELMGGDLTTVYQYFQCEDCTAVLGRQKAPPSLEAVWQMIVEPEAAPEEDEYVFVLTHAGGSIVAH